MRYVGMPLLFLAAALAMTSADMPIDHAVNGKHLRYTGNGAEDSAGKTKWNVGDDWSKLDLSEFTLETVALDQDLGVPHDAVYSRLLVNKGEKVPLVIQELYHYNGKVRAEMVSIFLSSELPGIPTPWVDNFMTKLEKHRGQPNYVLGVIDNWDYRAAWLGKDGQPDMYVWCETGTYFIIWALPEDRDTLADNVPNMEPRQ